MTGTDRRNEILDRLEQSQKPLSATALAKELGVSRQIIVQDVALLRAAGNEILSTNRGYVLQEKKAPSRVYKVNHNDEQIEDELFTIVDLGGRIQNVEIHHKVYGVMEAPLRLTSRLEVKGFMEDLKSGKSSPLKNITSGYHYHVVEANSEEILDLIEKELLEKGYLVV